MGEALLVRKGGGGVNVTIDGVKVKDDLVLKSVFGDWKLEKLPYSFTNSSAVVLNNEIHVLGNSDTTTHYKFNGTSWVQVSTLPYNFYNGSAVVLDGEIHILGGSGGSTNHYLVAITLYMPL